jgi:uncharacterized protein YbjT (DUF2867 family)
LIAQGDTILLTGASGFVGGRLWPALDRGGYRVRCLSREPEKGRRRFPEREWVAGDVGEPESLQAALDGCAAAYFLVHRMGDAGSDFRQRETAAAARFQEAAGRAGMRRIVYLGGMAPSGPPSEHLASRLEVGETLRSGPVPAVELRASMIVGYGSLPWRIVRDLAARLPFMVLPRWLRSRTQPVAIDDVVLALTRCLDLPQEGSAWYDLPGPDTLSGTEILWETARLLGLRRPRMLQVPFLSPWLSSHWVRLVTRADWPVAREVVVGLTHDVVATDDRLWREIGHAPLRFAEAACRAIAEEQAQEAPGGFWGAEERFVARYFKVAMADEVRG